MILVVDDQVSFQASYNLFGDVVISIYDGPWFVDEAVLFVRLDTQLLPSKIKYSSLPALEADGREVNAVCANFYIRESLTKIFVISPERDDLSIEVDQCANYVTYRPRLSIPEIISIAFLYPMPIVGVGSGIVTNTILAVEGGLQSAPSYLHESATLQHHLKVKAAGKDSGGRSHRRERTHGFDIEVIPARKEYVTISRFLVKLCFYWTDPAR